MHGDAVDGTLGQDSQSFHNIVVRRPQAELLKPFVRSRLAGVNICLTIRWLIIPFKLTHDAVKGQRQIPKTPPVTTN
jgi:hypothetical protein